jgi:hypothetical protein
MRVSIPAKHSHTHSKQAIKQAINKWHQHHINQQQFSSSSSEDIKCTNVFFLLLLLFCFVSNAIGWRDARLAMWW